LIRVEPAGTVIDPKELYYAIADAVTSLWGDAVAGVIMQAVVAAEHGHVIIRCLRGTEKELALALSTVTTCRDVRLALRIVAASGTMESLRERIRPQKSETESAPEPATGSEGNGGTEPRVCIFAQKSFHIMNCNGQKVDVIEKGFKNAHRLFLTKSDLENS
ncbi:MAG TPA: Rpp14/Pop5 family protein, partial [Methanoregula sp.]|nr:Rpp14/Pop5 family protein [Methanoregula sp.]